MASITRQQNGRREIQFVGPDQKRRTIRLGKVSQKTADMIRTRVEEMANAKLTGESVSPHTAQWLRTIGEQLHDRLVRVGLCQPRKADEPVYTLKSMLDAYIDRRDDVKASTKTIYCQAQRHLQSYFGCDRTITTITVADAIDFRRTIRKQYSEAFTAKLIIKARTFWRDAVDRKLVESNVFSKVQAGSQVNTAKHRYIDRSSIERVIAVCSDPQWKLLIALSRYAGLRCPSEHLALKWSDVDWNAGKITVRAAKTEHHPNRGIRIAPIFVELRPYLLAVHEQRDTENEYVITRYRSANANLRTQFIRFIKKAGLSPWPRLFHNLRASCQTDLAERFPSHVVCDWIGNSEVIAKAHYLQTTEDHFAKAIASGNGQREIIADDAVSDAAPSGTALQPIAPSTEDIEKSVEILQSAIQCAIMRGEEWAIQGSNL